MKIKTIKEYTKDSNIQFCHIAPSYLLDYIPEDQTIHVVLAHLLPDPSSPYINDQQYKYIEFYKKRQERGDYIILDNGAYENHYPMTTEQLIRCIKYNNFFPDYLVAPDFPFEDWKKTYNSLLEFKKIMNKELPNVGIFGVPQSRLGDVEGYLKCLELMVKTGVDIIGLSIIGVPNAFCNVTQTKDVSTNRIFATSIIKKMFKDYDKLPYFHLLGADSPNEYGIQHIIGLAKSMDSSSAIWHGYNNIKYDDSFSGLKEGKTKLPVKFFDMSPTPINKKIILYNIKRLKLLIP